jgi:hypothetical protein
MSLYFGSASVTQKKKFSNFDTRLMSEISSSPYLEKRRWKNLRQWQIKNFASVKNFPKLLCGAIDAYTQCASIFNPAKHFLSSSEILFIHSDKLGYYGMQKMRIASFISHCVVLRVTQ